MPQLVVLVIIVLIYQSVKRNLDINKQKRQAQQQETEYRPRAQAPQDPAGTSGANRGEMYRPSLRDLLKGHIPTQEIPYAPPAPAQPIQGEGNLARTAYEKATRQVRVPAQPSWRDGEEGCVSPVDHCDAPHHEPEHPQWGGEAREGNQRKETLSFLHNQPELVKGIIYSEILTRPIHRRRHYP